MAAVKSKCAALCHHHLALSTDCLCLFYSLALESDRYLTLLCSTSSSFPAPIKATPARCGFAGEPALGRFETQKPSSNWSSSGVYVHGHGYGTLSGRTKQLPRETTHGWYTTPQAINPPTLPWWVYHPFLLTTTDASLKLPIEISSQSHFAKSSCPLKPT